MVLNELEHDVTLRRIGVEALITLFVVLLVKNDLVLALGNLQIVGSTMHTQRIGLQSSRDASLGQGIRMDGDKEVGLVAVGNIGTGVQGNKHIRLTGVDYLHIRAVALHQLSESQRHIQVDDFLFCKRTDSSGVVATMSGINHQCKLVRLGSRSEGYCLADGNQRHHQLQHYNSQKTFIILHCECKSTYFPEKISDLHASFIIY